MRRLLSVCLLLSLGACALFEPSGQRYVVFFPGSSAQMEASAEEHQVGAADWAKKHPDMPVTVASYADLTAARKRTPTSPACARKWSSTDWSPTA